MDGVLVGVLMAPCVAPTAAVLIVYVRRRQRDL